MRMTLPTGSVITAIYTTTDSKDQVVELPAKTSWEAMPRYMTTRTALFSLVQKGQKETIMVTVSQNEAQDEGKTKIAIMHTKSTKE